MQVVTIAYWRVFIFILHFTNNGTKEKTEELEDGECSRQEEEDDEEGQEYILETYETNNLMKLNKKDNQQAVNDDSIDVSNLINQYRSLPTNQEQSSNASNNSETIKIL